LGDSRIAPFGFRLSRRCSRKAGPAISGPTAAFVLHFTFRLSGRSIFARKDSQALIMTDHENSDLVARANELLNGPPYFNVATASNDGQPWNTPVWAARGKGLSLYWSSWVKATHSKNIEENPRAFLTLFDSTRKRGTNNLRCLYLQCTVTVVVDSSEAQEAALLLYPGEVVELTDFLGNGLKRFYKATPKRAWLNCLSERELTPSTVKMRVEVPLELLRAKA
jgi:Pyridoxamine 5'-phosphate oxidase